MRSIRHLGLKETVHWEGNSVRFKGGGEGPATTVLKRYVDAHYYYPAKNYNDDGVCL